MIQPKLEVVIVGAGFAGLKAARELKKRRDIHVTLISERDEFWYSPTMYRTATGHWRRESCIPLTSIIRKYKNLTFVPAKAKTIDREARQLVTEDGQTFTYDYAILALGVVTSYFGIPGVQELSYNIKTSDGLDRLRTHLHQELTEDGEMDKNYIVIGAGPTGVELAAALKSYLKRIAKMHKIKKSTVHIELIEAAPKVLPVFKERVSRLATKRLKKLGVKLLLGQKVEGETETSLTVSGRSIPTQTVIWTAGVTNNPFFAANPTQFELNEKKKVVVNEFLQVDPHTFVVGDNAATKYSGLALTAVRDGRHAARYIKSTLRHLQPHKHRNILPVSVVPVGGFWAIFVWGWVIFGGKLGALLRIGGDFVGYYDIMGVNNALAIMRKMNDYEETCPTCKSGIIKE